jgi:glycosyltransferase involved in cell wall biosynthesis
LATETYLQQALNAFLQQLLFSMTLSPEEIVIDKRRPIPESTISLIIPIFNQSVKISYSLKKIKQALELAFSNYELIVVHDGSTDDTLTILKGVAMTDEHVHILSYTPNRGKGYAVRQGVLHSHGDAVIFLDGDLDISPDLVKDYVERLSTSDLVIASKRHPDSIVRIPRSREFLSRAFNLLIKVTLGITQRDTQAGLKVGKGEIMRTIFRNVSVNRYAFDVELLTIASILHLKVQEMPVIMKIERRFNTKEIVKMFSDVMRIYYKHKLLHRYDKELIGFSAKLERNKGQYQQDNFVA